MPNEVVAYFWDIMQAHEWRPRPDLGFSTLDGRLDASILVRLDKTWKYTVHAGHPVSGPRFEPGACQIWKRNIGQCVLHRWHFTAVWMQNISCEA